MKKYYLYKHTRLDTNEVFYIGIGKQDKKDSYSRAYNKNKRTSFWKNIVSKTNYKVDIIFKTNNHKELVDKEIKLIEFYGRRCTGEGSLVNLTLGGEGVLGHTHSKESIEKAKQTLKRKIAELGQHPNAIKTRIKKGQMLKANNFIRVIDENTGIIYPSISEVAREFNLKIRVLHRKIVGKRKNNTSFKIYKFNQTPLCV